MRYIIEVLRRVHGGKPYKQSFYYDAVSENDTVATALKNLNENGELVDVEGNRAEYIDWECSCLQKKCGSCAMVICGVPNLACRAKLSDYKNGIIKLEPLRKFPVIADLVADRSVMRENLKIINGWLTEDADVPDKKRNIAYLSSKCLQCGCCLEVCPNFYVGGKFMGMSVGVLTTRLLSELPVKSRKQLAKNYEKFVFEGCGKSLACKDVCPAGIKTDEMLVNSTAMAIWKRR